MSKNIGRIFRGDQVDFDALEAELEKKIEEEEAGRMQNEVKMRAINEVTSYDQFRDRVNAAHLRPLEKRDSSALRKMPSKVLWNKNVGGKQGGNDALELEK